MKKITLFAIAALGVFALASCQKEAEAPVADGKAIQVTVIPEVEKAFLDDASGFQFAANDNLYWVSEDGNASQTIETETKTPTVTMTIPGLATKDVTGYFASFDGDIDFTEQEVTPACGDIFVAGKQITIPAATESIEVAVGIVGSAFRFFPYGADFTAETIQSITVSSASAFAGTATYNAEDGTVSCTPTATAVIAAVPAADQINVESAKGASYIVKVPEGTIVAPVFKVRTDAAEYTFTCSADKVCKAGYVYDTPLNFAKAARVEPYEISIAAADVTSNDPMQYVVGGSDTYGLQPNYDWFGSINGAQASARSAKYGLGENLFDDDLATCYHTNLDWGEPGTSWGQRNYSINSNQWEQRYIQVDLPAIYNGVDLAFTLSDSGRKPEGIIVKTSSDFSGYTQVAAFSDGIDFGASFEASANGKVSSIRIVNTKGDADWTFVASAFGIAELSVITFDADPDPIPVSSVTLDKPSLTLAEGVNAILVATVHPDKATDKSVTWSSEDEGVATVVNGVVTGVSEGETVITVETVSGGFTATCTVEVVGLDHKVITVGDKTSDMQLQGGAYYKHPLHAFTVAGPYAKYIEFVQGGNSYYYSAFEDFEALDGRIRGLSIATASTSGGEDFTLPASGCSGTYFMWITDDGGWLQDKVIEAGKEIGIESSWDWSGATSGVSSTLEAGKHYASVVYDRTGSSAKWKLFEVTTTKPE